MNIFVKVHDEAYREFYEADNEARHFDFFISGRGSGKTQAVIKKLKAKLINDSKTVVVIFRETLTSVKQSFFTDLVNSIESNTDYYNYFKNFYEIKTDTIIRKATDDKVAQVAVFCRGFKTVKKDDVSALKGTSSITDAVLEEMENLSTEDDRRKVQVLIDSLREETLHVYYIMNSVYTDHYVIKRYFEIIEEIEIMGETLCKIALTKEAKNDGYRFFYTTYKSNSKLASHTSKQYDSYNDITHVDYDPVKYYFEQLGYCKKSNIKSFFNVNLVKDWNNANKLEPIRVKKGLYEIYKSPVAGGKYFAGCDTSTGTASDKTSFSIYDFYTLEEVCHANFLLQESESADLIMRLCHAFNYPTLNIELNYTGRIVLRYLLEMNYPTNKLYYDDKTAKEKLRVGKPVEFGTTTGIQRMILLSDLKNAINKGEYKLHSLEKIKQLEHFILINGKYQAEATFNDDAVMEMAMAHQAFKFLCA